ncbi:peptidylprolyl isomerase [Cecembia sp.]|uniref:peptidylprolyl isomerase n=1 Tax=Cecembia sp. TaxID=1898110 RepID=UPI0025BC5AED|nr:peptidylprolyl isomerase [Cecembia sp.]
MSKNFIWYFLFAAVLGCSPKTTPIKEASDPEMSVPLLTIGNENIFADEFLHLLTKNRQFQDKEDKLNPEEFDENLELFINYKLKVKEAENLGLDTLEEFRREFEVFKEDLIQPYLIKNSLQQGELIKAYNRMKEVVKASHILLQFPNNASREDTVAVFRMAQKLKEEAEAGADFNQLALEHSEDPSAKDNKGSLGYFTALQMVHQFEDAAFGLDVGDISDPILTNFGYHIIKLEDRKPNPGEIKVSHILVRTQPGDPVSEERALRKVGDIYTELQKPESLWEEVCKMYSEDLGSKNSGGALPWIGLGSVIPEFERVAFSISEVGEISPPVKTPYGYHIIRLDEQRPIPSYEEMEASIKSRILRDSRSSLIQSQVTAIQKSRYGFQENGTALLKVQKLLDETNSLEKFKEDVMSNTIQEDVLFMVEDQDITVKDLLVFMENEKNKVSIGSRNSVANSLDRFIEYTLNTAEERDLLANNKEYSLLLREYRDGILLFSLMNEQVWQRALMDSIGQVNFYEENKNQYLWNERVEALIVTLGKETYAESVRRFLTNKKYKKDLADRLENTFLLDNSLMFTMDEGLYEWEDHPVLSKVEINKDFHEIKINGKSSFILIGERVPPQAKKFEETRGKVIQDYQQFLDKILIQKLKANYIIRIDEDEKKKIYQLAVKD